MNNLVRKALRDIFHKVQQLRDDPSVSSFEADELNQGLIHFIRADVHDFHIYPNKCYVPPKSDFKFR